MPEYQTVFPDLLLLPPEERERFIHNYGMSAALHRVPPHSRQELALWSAAARMPKSFPMEGAATRIHTNVASSLGLIPIPFQLGVSTMLTRPGADIPTISDPIKTALQAKETFLPRDEDSLAVLQYLGCEPSQFLEQVSVAISDVAEEIARIGSIADEDIEAIRPNILNAIEFAVYAYSLIDKPYRKSGEPFSNHPIRALWYILGYIKDNRMSFSNVPQLIAFIETVLFHDILEDLRPDRENKIRNTEVSVAQEIHNGIPMQRMTVKDDFGSTRSYMVRSSQVSILQNLNATDPEQYMQDTLESRFAGLAKLADRLDNLLTLPQKSLYSLIGKLIETCGPSTRMVLLARYGRLHDKRRDDIKRGIRHDRMPELMPLTTLTLDLYIRALSQVLNSASMEPHVAFSQEGISFQNLNDQWPMRSMIECYANRISWMNGSERSASHRLFGYYEIAVYLRQVYDEYIRHPLKKV